MYGSRWIDLFRALAAPWPTDQVARPRDLSAEHVCNRLDDVFGPENWAEEYAQCEGCLCCTLTLRMPDGQQVAKQGFGPLSERPEAPAYAADLALLRAAARFGVGRYLADRGVAALAEPAFSAAGLPSRHASALEQIAPAPKPAAAKHRAARAAPAAEPPPAPAPDPAPPAAPPARPADPPSSAPPQAAHRNGRLADIPPDPTYAALAQATRPRLDVAAILAEPALPALEPYPQTGEDLYGWLRAWERAGCAGLIAAVRSLGRELGLKSADGSDRRIGTWSPAEVGRALPRAVAVIREFLGRRNGGNL